MKKYLGKYLRWHESFSGYDHRDAFEEHGILALNEKSALNKLRRLVPKVGWTTNHSVTRINSSNNQ